MKTGYKNISTTKSLDLKDETIKAEERRTSQGIIKSSLSSCALEVTTAMVVPEVVEKQKKKPIAEMPRLPRKLEFFKSFTNF